MDVKKATLHLWSLCDISAQELQISVSLGNDTSPVCSLYLGAFMSQNFQQKTTWARKGPAWGGGGEAAIGGCHNCTSSPSSFTHDCCSFKIPCYIFNCGHLADCLLLLRYCWILLSMWPQDKANNYQHQKQLVVLYYIEVNYTGIRVDYFYQMGNKLLINSLL